MLALVVFDKEPEPGEEGGAKLAYVLMPLIDAFNHASLPTKTEFEFSAAAFRLRSPAGKGKRGGLHQLRRARERRAARALRVRRSRRERRGARHLRVPGSRGLAGRQPRAVPPREGRPDGDRTKKSETRAWEDDVSQGVFRNDGTADANLEWALRCALATPEEDQGGQHLRRVQAGGGGAGETRAREGARRGVRGAPGGDGNLRRRGRGRRSLAATSGTARASPCSTAWRRSGS